MGFKYDSRRALQFGLAKLGQFTETRSSALFNLVFTLAWVPIVVAIVRAHKRFVRRGFLEGGVMRPIIWPLVAVLAPATPAETESVSRGSSSRDSCSGT